MCIKYIHRHTIDVYQVERIALQHGILNEILQRHLPSPLVYVCARARACLCVCVRVRAHARLALECLGVTLDEVERRALRWPM